MSGNLAALLYLAAGILFILALRGLSSPATSRQGNLFGMIGMGVAVVHNSAAAPAAGSARWILVSSASDRRRHRRLAASTSK